MQQKMSQNAIFFLVERLKSYFQVDTDLKLSEILGVKANTVSTWKTRNSIDYNLIIAKCDKADLHWLIKGESFSKGIDQGLAAACPMCVEKDREIDRQKQEIITLLKEKVKLLEDSSRASNGSAEESSKKDAYRQTA
ncbi:MAG: helix-turn-helix domain-containing protein [Bacteroidota bacterium]